MNTAKSTEKITTTTAGMTTGLVTSADGTPLRVSRRRDRLVRRDRARRVPVGACHVQEASATVTS